MKWKLVGYDTFSDEWYFLDSFATEREARAAALRRLGRLEVSQPTADSGGQGIYGIQDRVFIEGPDGTRSRVWPD